MTGSSGKLRRRTFDYLSGSGERSRQHTWLVTVASAENVKLTEHDAHAWAADANEYPVSSEVRALISTGLTGK